MNLTTTEQLELLSFVRETIAAELHESPPPPVPPLDMLKLPGASFVSLKSRFDGALRGCIGSLDAFEPLADNLRRNALNAAFADPRFPPMEPEELNEIAVEISLIGESRPIAGASEFRVGEEGIILEADGRRAVFLPQVAREERWTREETLSYLARKAGLPPDAWRVSGANLKVFPAGILTEE